MNKTFIALLSTFIIVSTVLTATAIQPRGGETRPVLNPDAYDGMARAAYTAAAKYRDVMDKIYCYCMCDNPHFNHKSLLSCFVTDHGAT